MLWACDLKNPASAPGRTSCRKRWNLMIMSTGSGARGHSANGAHCTHSMMNDSIRDSQINIQTEQTCSFFSFPRLLYLLTVHVGPLPTRRCWRRGRKNKIGRKPPRSRQHIQIGFDSRIRNIAQPGGCCSCFSWRNYRASRALATGIDSVPIEWMLQSAMLFESVHTEL